MGLMLASSTDEKKPPLKWRSVVPGRSVNKVVFQTEAVVDSCFVSGKFLERPHESILQHDGPSSSELQVDVFHPDVRPSAHFLLVCISKLVRGGTLAA